jgi:hypothetical protein
MYDPPRMESGESRQGRARWEHGIWRFAALYAVLTLVLAYPLSIRPATHVLADGPDTRLLIWALGWDTHAFTHHPLSMFDANIYYPEHHTLAYSENVIGSALFAAPILWITGNPVLALNIVTLLSCMLCGVGAHLLARAVGLRPSAALLTGIIFAFSPPRFFRLSQLHLATVQWIPFALASFHRYFEGGRRRDLRIGLAFFTLQAFTSGHGAALLLVALLVLAAHRLLAGDRLALATRISDVGLPGGLLLAPLVWLLIPYRRVQIEMGLQRAPGDWLSNWSSFLASPTHLHAFVLSLLPNAHVNDTAQAFLFPGYLPVILACGAFLFANEGRRPDDGEPSAFRRRTLGQARVFYLLLTVLTIWLSAGPPGGLWQLVYWLPGLNLIRVPSRFSLLTVLGLAVLAGSGFERAARSLTASARGRLAAALSVLLIVEFAALPLGTARYQVQIPAIDRWLATQPQPFAIAELPLANRANLGSWERRHTEFMLHSTAHWQKTVEGYSGFRPPLHESLYAQLVNFPDEASLRSLAQLGVRYIVVHTDLYAPGAWPAVEARVAMFADWLTLERTEGSGRVYRLRPPSERAQR